MPRLSVSLVCIVPTIPLVKESKKEKQRGEGKREENKRGRGRGRGEREKLGWDIDVGRHGLHAQTLIIQKELPVWRVRVAEHLNNC